MTILRDFERRLEGLVEGLFAKTFRSGLQPVELAKRILRDMDSGRTVGVDGRVLVPNHYVFRLSPEDRERFESAEHVLVAQLRQVVRDGAKERGWGLVGSPGVVFETGDRLKKGEFRCEATLVEGVDDAVSGDEALVPAGAELDLLEGGRRTKAFPLTKKATSLGRLGDCDVVVPDPAASRRHAEIRNEGDTFTLVDLGSTNGTLVNDGQVTEQTLEDGDRITIGATEFEFRRT